MRMALIPARGGSKRIPRKNIRRFHGRPIIAFTIEAAKHADLFDRIIVSTEDDEIAEIAQALGAETPFRRPAELADDDTTTLQVVQHALAQLEREGLSVDFLCCLYPAAPLILSSDIKRAYDLLRTVQADYCVPVTDYPYPIQRALVIRSDERLQMLTPELADRSSQGLERCYHDAGQFYWGTSEAFAKGVPLLSSQAVALRLPSWRVCDIDSEDDWRRAEVLYRVLEEQHIP